MQEIWKDITGYEGLYQVSNMGNVKSLNYNHTKKPKILIPKRHHSGYRIVMLCKNGAQKNASIHVLVADAFLPNPEGKSQVNHIDGNKSNNAVSNLEWVTASENTRHAISQGLRLDTNMRGKHGINHPSSKPVYQYSKNGVLIKKWNSVSEAANYYNCSVCTICSCCSGRNKSCKGYIWKHGAR